MGKQLSPHFNEDEFRCRHCRGLPPGGMDPKLIEFLELMRGVASEIRGQDTPLHVLSGYRCPIHNMAVGGVRNSYHVQGKAADIDASKYGVDFLFDCARRAGFKRIGRYHSENFVHVDVGSYGTQGGTKLVTWRE